MDSSPTGPGELVEIEAGHGRHAIVGQIIAELKSVGLAYLPSGKFMANSNAVWLARDGDGALPMRR